MQFVTVRDRSRSVLEIRIERPEKRNALNQQVVKELTAAFQGASDSENTRVVVLAADGEVFSAGADLWALRAMHDASREENDRDSRLLSGMFESILRCSKPVVARVHGHAIAGGCGLVAACDFAIASSAAKLGFTEVAIGFVPAIVSAIASHRMRGSDLRTLMLSGRPVNADEAVRMGLVTEAVPSDELDATIDAFAHGLAQLSGEALASTKHLLNELPGMPLGQALELAIVTNVLARESADCKEGISAFLEKRDPSWRSGAIDSDDG